MGDEAEQTAFLSPITYYLSLVMAEVKDILPDNTPGEFYVDRECIDCDVCRDEAPG